MKKVLIGLTVLILLGISGLVVFALTINPDTYRLQLVDVLTKKTGRNIRIDGPVHLDLSLEGLKIRLKDVALGNPAWASRENMASIGTFELGIDPLPLLQRKLVISKLTISKADIQLETGTDSSNNWKLVAADQPEETKNHSPELMSLPLLDTVTIGDDHLLITNSQLVVRTNTGRKIVFHVDNLSLAKHGQGLDLDFRGMFNATPLAFKAELGTTDFMADHTWPLTLDLVYAFYRVQTKINLNYVAETLEIPSFLITAGASGIEGKVDLNWGSSPVVINGNVTSTHLALVDFLPIDAVSETDTLGSKADPNLAFSTFIFSNKSLGLERLKTVNASMNVAMNDIVLHAASLKKLSGQITLQDGVLDMPLKVELAKGVLAENIKLNVTTSPAQLLLTSSSSNIDLADLLALAGSPAVLTGKADANAAISATGDSFHDLASSMTGTIDVVAAGGEVSSSAAKDISSSLMDLIAPDGSSVLNCLAARFIAKNGIVHDNGVLIDTPVTTIMGKGEADMSSETLNLTMRAHTKLSGLGGLLPPLYVGGTFLKPNFSIDSKSVVQSVVGVLSGGSLESGIPEVVAQPAQNACLYALNHPVAMEASSVLLPGIDGQVQKLKNISKQFLNGLFGQ